MAAEIIPAGLSPVLPDPPLRPGLEASRTEHADWCERFAEYCARQAQFALELKIGSYSRWLKAERLSRFAAEMWRERQEGAV